MMSLSRRRFVLTCAAFALPFPLRAQPTGPAFDLVIRGGIVIDPARGMQARADVGIRDGRIAAIDDLSGAVSGRIVEAADHVVAPGLIDLQTRIHAMQRTAGLPVDVLAGHHGVTAWASAGDIEPADLPAFQRYSRRHSRARLYAFVNFDRRTAARAGEAKRALARVFAEHHDIAIGVVLRFDNDPNESARALLDAAIDQLRIEQTRARILCPLPRGADADALVAGLRPGDILTQAFRDPRALLHEGKVAPGLVAARNRGVIIDAGHGGASFDGVAARTALEQGFVPDIISSRVPLMPPPFAPQLTQAMSAFMAMGLPIEQILAMTTVNPGRVLGREPHLGTLALGAPADIVLLKIDAGSGGSRIDPVLTLRSGVPLRSA